MGRLPAFVPRITTSREPDSRGCRYSLMFRPPSLLAPQIVPTAAILPQGSRGFYVRAYRALLPPHAPDMLTVRVQVIDGTGTVTLSDSQPCRLLTLSHRPSPKPHWVGSSTAIRSTTSEREVFRGCSHLIIFRPPSLLPPRSFPPLPTRYLGCSGRPWRLRPSTARFVASPRIGYASRPRSGN